MSPFCVRPFAVPGRSALAGVYRDSGDLSGFFARLHELSARKSGGPRRRRPGHDDRMVLFLRFTAQLNADATDVVVAGFHDDRGPDDWRRAAFLVDDLAGFDRFFAGA